MTQNRWNSLSLFEQLSNVAGDVKRMVDTKENYENGTSKEDFSEFYFNRVKELVNMTIIDPKNTRRGKELLDEIVEIERYRNNEVSKEYILNYWDQYTQAIS